jgi:nucleotide-binding universal stress UspA family protein
MSAIFSNILLAFDGSESSIVALKNAESLAILNDARLTVVYVEDYPSDNSILPIDSVPNNDLMFEPPTNIGSNLITNGLTGTQTEVFDENTADRILADARVRLFSNALQEVIYEVLEGNPAREICAFAKQNEIGLIVIGNRGLSGIKKLVMGSVSHQVANHADCPVLVCK